MNIGKHDQYRPKKPGFLPQSQVMEALLPYHVSWFFCFGNSFYLTGNDYVVETYGQNGKGADLKDDTYFDKEP